MNSTDHLHTDALALAPTLEPLVAAGLTPHRVFDRLAAMHLRFVQLSATQPGMRPRELDRSSRRDVLATLRRAGLAPSGIDAWIPVEHFQDANKVDRAVTAILTAIDLAADLNRVPLSLMLPDDPAVVPTVVNHAQHRAVELVDHSVPVRNWPEVALGIDPAAWISQGFDPIAGVHANAGRISCARLCDLMRTGMRGPISDELGKDGRLDVLSYKVALSVNRYPRPVVIDATQWTDPWSGVARTAAQWIKI